MLDPYTPDSGTPRLRIEHYDLDIDYRVASNRLTAKAVLRGYVTADTDVLDLDLTGLQVRKTRVNNTVVDHTHRPGKLILHPGDMASGEKVTIEVSYAGHPEPAMGTWGDIGWEELTDGVLVAGQPTGAATWFPGNDHPSNKATYRIEVTCDNGYTVVSNGDLVGTRRRAGRTVWTYESTVPLASYLATVQIGRYRTGPIPAPAEHPATRVPLQLAAPPGRFKHAVERLGLQHRMMTVFEEMFGPYPFSHYTVVVTDDTLEIPLESQPLSILGPNHLRRTWEAERLVAHELAHQWFGNSVTLNRWRDIWLHEGFACYAEWLWSEAAGSKTCAEHARHHHRKLLFSRKNLVVGDPGGPDMFDDRVYKRGALALHAMRAAAGDRLFFTVLQEWTTRFRHSSVGAEDFFALVTRTAGTEAAEAMKPWLHQPELPALPEIPATPTGVV